MEFNGGRLPGRRYAIPLASSSAEFMGVAGSAAWAFDGEGRRSRTLSIATGTFDRREGAT
jgi:hypothetical protein